MYEFPAFIEKIEKNTVYIRVLVSGKGRLIERSKNSLNFELQVNKDLTVQCVEENGEKFLRIIPAKKSLDPEAKKLIRKL